MCEIYSKCDLYLLLWKFHTETIDIQIKMGSVYIEN